MEKNIDYRHTKTAQMIPDYSYLSGIKLMEKRLTGQEDT